MKQIKLAKTDQGFEILDRWHARFEEKLSFEKMTRKVKTSFGKTDVLITKSENIAGELPVVVLHGAMAGAPFALGELCDLPSRKQFYAINIPGQSTRAEQVRLDFKTDEYGRWLSEIFDELQIEKAIVCGVSWGGSVALQFAKHCPERVAGLVLVVPASIVSGPVLKNIWHVALPMMRFNFFPTEANAERALKRIFSSTDPFWSPYMVDALKHWKVDFSVPPLMTEKELNSFEAPVFVIGAENDLSFPGEKLLARSKELFSNLVGTHLLEGSNHSPSFEPKERERFTQIFENALQLVQTNSMEMQ